MAKTAKSTARQRAEAARRQRERLERRARRVRTAWWAIAAGPAFVVLLILIKVAIPSPSGPGDDQTALSTDTLAALAPSASSLDTVARGQGVSFPKRADNQPPLVAEEKPQVLYVGAEYCPFCASQRWGLVIALNRFGDFTGLTGTRSGAPPEPFPNTATLSFHGATYTSGFLSFTGVELSDREQKPLQSLTPEQEQVVRTYDAPPWTQSTGSVPFVDFGNRFLQTGTSYTPDLLAGLSHDQIASEINNNPGGAVAQAILGSANAFTAILCALTNGQPEGVCTSPAALAYQQEVS
jgi:hypothetical protein